MNASLLLLVRLLAASRLTDVNKLIAHGRELAWDLGIEPNPVGASNSKTGTPGTYRPVGASCPACPLEAACYARYGPVGLHQERASTDVVRSLAAASIAMVAASKVGTLARLHVAGDFFVDGVVDAAYVDGLVDIADEIRSRAGIEGPVAWSYTHAPAATFEPVRERLARAGVVVLYSSHAVPGGAVVHPHAELDELAASHSGVQFRACPAQRRADITCRDCGLCWRARTQGVCIVFDPHGPGAARAPRRLSTSPRVTDRFAGNVP